MRDRGLAVIEPESEAEDECIEHVQVAAHKTLFPQANSWYMGADIPGRPRLFMPYMAASALPEDLRRRGQGGLQRLSP